MSYWDVDYFFEEARNTLVLDEVTLSFGVLDRALAQARDDCPKEELYKYRHTPIQQLYICGDSEIASLDVTVYVVNKDYLDWLHSIAKKPDSLLFSKQADNAYWIICNEAYANGGVGRYGAFNGVLISRNYREAYYEALDRHDFTELLDKHPYLKDDELERELFFDTDKLIFNYWDFSRFITELLDKHFGFSDLVTYAPDGRMLIDGDDGREVEDVASDVDTEPTVGV